MATGIGFRNCTVIHTSYCSLILYIKNYTLRQHLHNLDTHLRRLSNNCFIFVKKICQSITSLQSSCFSIQICRKMKIYIAENNPNIIHACQCGHIVTRLTKNTSLTCSGPLIIPVCVKCTPYKYLRFPSLFVLFLQFSLVPFLRFSLPFHLHSQSFPRSFSRTILLTNKNNRIFGILWIFANLSIKKGYD